MTLKKIMKLKTVKMVKSICILQLDQSSRDKFNHTEPDIKK